MDSATVLEARGVARAIEAGIDPAPATVGQCARQGDVVLTRIGDATQAPDVDAVAVLVEGAHGAHVALGRVAVVEPGRLIVGEDGCLIAHTDSPSCRHRALSLRPGEWEYVQLRELSVEGEVRKVVD